MNTRIVIVSSVMVVMVGCLVVLILTAAGVFNHKHTPVPVLKCPSLWPPKITDDMLCTPTVDPGPPVVVTCIPAKVIPTTCAQLQATG